VTAFAVLGLVSGFDGAGHVPKKFDSLKSGYSSEEIEVKFIEGTAVDQPESLLPSDLWYR